MRLRRNASRPARGEVRNVEVEVKGSARASEIVIVGAHYDSVLGAPGANDNGSGVAAVLELARLVQKLEARRARCASWCS